MAQVTLVSAFERALKRVLDDAQNTFDVAELHEIAGCSKKHVYSCLDPGKDRHLSVDKAEKISRYLSEHGEYRPAYAMLEGNLRVVRARTGEADGDATDDVMDVVKAATGLDDAYDELDAEEARRCLNDIRHELADLESEIARMQARQ